MAASKRESKAFAAGDRIHEWILESPLGRGGSSEVWSARDMAGDRFALKILVSQELSKIIRFVREVELMDAIRDRIAVPIYDVYLPGCADPPACYTMPIGDSLRSHLEDNEVNAADRVAILAEVGDCLSALHRRGLFHCDVKPGNIYLLAGRWVFGDFGLAIRKNLRLLAGPEELPGTREYTAPELYDQNISNDTDWAACDSFSFGKTIWTVMTGRRRPPPGPHRRGDPKTALKSVVGNRPGIRELDRLIRQAVAGHPSNRPTVAEITAGLREWHEAFADKTMPATDRARALIPTIAAE